MAPAYSQIIKKLGSDRVKLNEPLANYTTFKIGGPADLFYVASTEKQLIEVVKLVQKLNVPYFLLSAGSNLLISDQGFRGLVIKVANQDLQVKPSNSDYLITAEAGVGINQLISKAVSLELAGLEFLTGIPGSIGGAVRGNAGAWQQNIGDKAVRVKIFTPEGKIKWLSQKECHFSYRQSIFKDSKSVILAVELLLKKGDLKQIQKTIDLYLEKRRLQPNEPSAGCIFINPQPQSAGALIDQSGLKGKTVGGAQISPKHANFIINLGKAKASDIIALIKIAQEKVKKNFGICLKEEICLVGFSK